MPSLLLLPNFPNTNGAGQEGLGKGIDTVTGLVVTPEGETGTPAQIRTLIRAELAGNDSTIRLAQLWRQPNSF